MEITEATVEYIEDLLTEEEFFETGIECPYCQGQLIVRKCSFNKHKFLGCINYPDCKQVIDVKRFKDYYEDLHIIDDPNFMERAYSNYICDDDYHL